MYKNDEFSEENYRVFEKEGFQEYLFNEVPGLFRS